MARRQVSIFLDGKQVESTLSNIYKSKRQIVKQLNRMVEGSDEYNKTIAQLGPLNKTINNHRQKLRGVESTYDKMKAGISKYVGIAAGAFAVTEIIGYGKELFSLGTEMEVLTKKAQTVFGSALPQVTRAAENNAAAMGLTVSQYTDASAAIGDLLIPMGFQRQEAANISTSLVDLSGALSEWTGGQKSAKEVTEILGKAILGEREQLKTLGISIQEADVKARLQEKGLDKLTGTMLQQAKAAATLELITEKSTDAQAAFAANSDTLVRKQAELTAKFQDVKENMATALIPVFHRLLEVAEPIVTTIADLIIAMLNGEEATGKLSGGMKVVATMLGNVANVVGFVFGAFKKLGGFLLDNFGGTIQFVAGLYLDFYNTMVAGFNGLNDLIGLDYKMKPIDIEDFKSSLGDAKKALSDSGIEDQSAGNKINAPNLNVGQSNSAGDKRRKQLQSQYEKELKDRQRSLEKLSAILIDHNEEQRISELSESEKRLDAIKLRWEKEIDLAKELEARGVKEATSIRLELEKIRDQELNDLFIQLSNENIAKEESRIEEEYQAAETKRKEVAERRANLIAELNEFAALAVQQEQQTAIELLKEHYEELKQLAEEQGIDTLDIEISYRRQKDALIKDLQEKEIKEAQAAAMAQLDAIGQAFGSMADVVSAATALAGDEAKKQTELSKLLAVIQIGISSAKALAEATASAASVPFPGNLVAIASAVATVLGNMAQARKLLASTPEVPQRYTGGPFNVRGQQDGKTYSANYLGRRNTGLLPSTPSLVLASERGAEYFVSHSDLQNPYVIDHVRAIENIRRFGSSTSIPQFAEGGFTDTATSTQQPNQTVGSQVSFPPEMFSVFSKLINVLNNIQENGIDAYISDDTLVNMQKRLAKIERSSGRNG